MAWPGGAGVRVDAGVEVPLSALSSHLRLLGGQGDGARARPFGGLGQAASGPARTSELDGLETNRDLLAAARWLMMSSWPTRPAPSTWLVAGIWLWPALEGPARRPPRPPRPGWHCGPAKGRERDACRAFPPVWLNVGRATPPTTPAFGDRAWHGPPRCRWWPDGAVVDCRRRRRPRRPVPMSGPVHSPWPASAQVRWSWVDDDGVVVGPTGVRWYPEYDLVAVNGPEGQLHADCTDPGSYTVSAGLLRRGSAGPRCPARGGPGAGGGGRHGGRRGRRWCSER